MILYRPVGRGELEKIWNLDRKGFPPRFDTQPIFYPVLNEEYAIQIAREWNLTDNASGYAGYVTRFEVDGQYVSKFERKIVGGRVHEELWVPSDELEEFNLNILGDIEVIHAFHSIEFMRKGISEEEWSNQIDRFVEETWVRMDNIPCHNHCVHCDATLCSIHPCKSGDDYDFAFGVSSHDYFHSVTCPPCFQALAEKYGLEVS